MNTGTKRILALVMALVAMAVGTTTGAMAEKMTDLGTPRAQTLIVDMLSGRDGNATVKNVYMPGSFDVAGTGYVSMVIEPLWDVNSITGEQEPILAETMAVPDDDTYTKFTVKLRKGVYWSDGVEFTASDVVFTSDMLLANPELPYSARYSDMVKSMTVVDDYTFSIETTRPEYRLEQTLGVPVVDTSFKVVPKHIWEKIEDPCTYNDDSLAIGTAQYILKDYDPQGNWVLYEKRTDWDRTATGIIAGEPKPQYVIYRTYGTEEKRIMAAIQNDLDILCDVTPESWEILRSKNPGAKAWFDGFPYADTDNPATRGIQFNTMVVPFDNKNVRWALTLATDIKAVIINSFSGMLKASAMPFPPTSSMTQYYYDPMMDWFRNFELDDGYKPFYEEFATDILELLKMQGVEGLPTDPQDIKNAFGVGWWKYDTQQAEQMLLAEGFTKQDGKWYLPDGQPWQFSVMLPAGFEVVSERIAYAVVDCWQKFGIDVVAQPADSATFWSVSSSGQFAAGSYWPTVNVLKDATGLLRGWHKNLVKPIGEVVAGNASRWSNDRVSELIDKLNVTPGDDPSVVPMCTEILEILVTEMPMMGVCGTSKFTPVIEHYWKNYQSNDNRFESPWWWCSNFRWSVIRYEPTGITE